MYVKFGEAKKKRKGSFIIKSEMVLKKCGRVIFMLRKNKTLSGSYNIEVTGYDWGPSVNKAILTFEKEISEVTKFLPTVDKFKEGIYSKDGDISMKYAYYEPDDDKKSPLIIWLHGVGEGGRDTTITTLGNRVGALIEDKIQNKFGGAYVLVPQSPTMWMDCTGNAEYTNDGKAIYTKSLFNLIKYYVDSNERIDRNRIYIGGCSNGGYMTIKMLFQDPEYFAAAYPICEAYNDSWISDEEITSIKNVPIWFTYAKNDRGVDPNENSKATIDRLIKAGNVNLHKSVFDSVVDTSGLYKDEEGNPYEYPGHFSWIYVFNDECKEGKESLWSWLAKQSKA